MMKNGVSQAGVANTVYRLLDAKKLTITRVTQPKEKLPNDKLQFGRSFTDHMLEIDWDETTGWTDPRIKPFENISLSPAATVFHYAMECFEGMKAYKDKDGHIRMFRPEMNMERFKSSSLRMAMPGADTVELLACIKELLKVEKDWIPEGKGYSLYIRPTMIGTQAALGVGASTQAKLMVFCSPVGPYFRQGFHAVSLLADPMYVRSWPGGVGSHKGGCNYAPGVVPQILGATKGYNQLLWLLGEKHNVTEVGTMNFFTLWKNEDGETELVTPPLDGTILPGVTRASILAICKKWGEFTVSERPFNMGEIVKGVEENRVLEMFGSGTACIVTPIKNIGYLGKDYAIPVSLGKSGELTARLNDMILAIQYGEEPSEWSVRID